MADLRVCDDCQTVDGCVCPVPGFAPKQPKDPLTHDEAKELLKKAFESPVYENGEKIFPINSHIDAVAKVWSAVQSGFLDSDIRMLFLYSLASFRYAARTELELKRSLGTERKKNTGLRVKVEEQRKQLRRLHESRRIDGAQYNELWSQHSKLQDQQARMTCVDEERQKRWAKEKRELEAKLGRIQGENTALRLTMRDAGIDPERS